MLKHYIHTQGKHVYWYNGNGKTIQTIGNVADSSRAGSRTRPCVVLIFGSRITVYLI